MIITVFGGCISGIEAQLITVEIKVQNGLPRFSIVGLGDSAIQESRERVIAALTMQGLELPDQILVNLSPADLKKVGSSLDLPIAIGVAAAMGHIDYEKLNDALIFGELSLSGKILPVRGAVAFSALAKRKNLKKIICPADSIDECLLVDGIDIIQGDSLPQVLEDIANQNFICDNFPSKKLPVKDRSINSRKIIGQEHALRGLQIAVAGGHHVLMIGPPGCGKTMIAQSMPGFFPKLNQHEILELVSIHSVAGSSIENILAGIPPFRSPHYNISQPGLIGGGSQVRPGEITLAHHGVLFLDELPEFPRSVIESLRLPLEAGKVLISRANRTVNLPAKFQLVAAMNPCPCGLHGYSEKCRCSKIEIDKYQKKISQAILDRIDMHISMNPIDVAKFINRTDRQEDSLDYDQLRFNIQRARESSENIFGCLPSEVSAECLQAKKITTDPAKSLLLNYASKNNISARSINKIMKVALTIMLLKGKSLLDQEEIAESLLFRPVRFQSETDTSAVMC